MKNPRLGIRQTIDLLQEVTNGQLDAAYRLKVTKEALWKHLRSIAREKKAPRGRK